MIKLFILAAVVAAGLVGVAQARTCSTSCNSFGGSTNCTTQCW
jgi:hypothetical protein